ncbi:MAG: sulfur carrier protein ThiS [Kiritimatiellae bacterium]|nr:sulfur carrier protein ThiS [Kiritimatiellia bacterium]
MTRINGVDTDAAGSTVAEYLSSAGFAAERVVVELNEEIVPRGRYADTVLRDGDRVEVVCFMGGV